MIFPAPELTVFSRYMKRGHAWRIEEQGAVIEVRNPADCPLGTAQWVGDGRTRRELAAQARHGTIVSVD